jgi:hypothetical protein
MTWDIKPTKIIEGQGLAKMLPERNEKSLGLNENDQMYVWILSGI